MRKLFLIAIIFLLLPFLSPSEALSQRWGFVEGNILDASTNEPVAGATVLVVGTNFGTAADLDGFYRFRLPEGEAILKFSAIGFAGRQDTININRRKTLVLNIGLSSSTLELGEITVEEGRYADQVGVHELQPQDIENLPTPFKDGFRALKNLPGVVSNNETSNEYSVRGGGYNENLVYLNGFEVLKPLRTKQGEQEGLGIINPDMTQSLTLFTGGFPSRYGGKLSSALDVRYQQPSGNIHGAVYASLLDLGATAGGSTLKNRVSWIAGVRRTQARRFFGSQQLKGEYDPQFTDGQLALNINLADGQDIELLGIWAHHQFKLSPDRRRTDFGSFFDLRTVHGEYSGQEVDGYDTQFGGIRSKNRLTENIRIEHDFGWYNSVETEDYDISGSVLLERIKDPIAGGDDPENRLKTGSGTQRDFANNRIAVRTLTGQGNWLINFGKNATDAGYYFRHYRFEDDLSEGTEIGGQDSLGNAITVSVDPLIDQARLNTWQAGGYLENTFDLAENAGQWILTAGLRFDYFHFNGEQTWSPRITTRYKLSDQLKVNAGWGIYYQAPTYREFRGEVERDGNINTALNRNLKSQRSHQFTIGTEYFIPKHRTTLRTEIWAKKLDNIITYSVDNVRLTYSGDNNATGYAYGLEFRATGELVPGLESWFNYSFLVAREDFLPQFEDQYTDGVIARPTDQRHTFSLFVQDYIPNEKSWKLNMRILYGSGLPFTAPVPGEKTGTITEQIPGERNEDRFPAYRRIDLGTTKTLKLSESEGGPKMTISFELLNIFDSVNTISYAWIAGSNGIWQRVPTRLTPRTINLRARINF